MTWPALTPAGSNLSDARRLLDRADADVLVVGHTHEPFELEVVGRGVIVNPGALLRAPVDERAPPATGTFGMIELPTRKFVVYSATDGTPVPIVRRTVVW